MNLPEVREAARKKLKGVCGVYKSCDGDPGRLCQNHSYGGPIGFGGVASGASFTNNLEALKRLRLKTRLVGPHLEPDTTVTIFGKKLSMPVLAASFAGLGGAREVITEDELCKAVVSGCKSAGTLAMRGDTVSYTLEKDPAIDAIAEAGGHGIKIVKPREQSILIQFLKKAEAAGAVAVGCDLDGCGSTNFARDGKPVFRKSVDDIRQLVQATQLPFVAKGIMCVDDALACIDAGVAAIAVSNHGGRVLDHTPGTAEVLPDIVKAVAGRTLVFVDGGIRTGFDVLKMLALGADACLIGRDLIRAAIGAGEEGVRLQMEHHQKTLAKAMLMTDCPSIEAITSSVLC